jgi:hypothetical protein
VELVVSERTERRGLGKDSIKLLLAATFNAALPKPARESEDRVHGSRHLLPKIREANALNGCNWRRLANLPDGSDRRPSSARLGRNRFQPAPSH